MALASVSSTRGAAEAAGIPPSTLQYWMDDPQFAHLRTQSRERVAEEFWATIQVGVREVARGLTDPDASLRDKAVALGVVYDKFALMTGGATNRSENRDITGSISDGELAAAVRAAEAVLADTGEGRTAEEAAVPAEG